MEDFTEYYQNISQLTQQLKDALKAENFALSNELLPKRLLSLKALDKRFKERNPTQQQIEQYQSFLREIQVEDQKQVDVLLSEKSQLMNESVKQVKNKAAIGQYKNISQNK